MASVLKLKTDIKKLKAAIASKATSGAIKTKLRGKLTTLENELDKLQPNKRKPKTTGPKSESALVRLAKKRRTNQGLSTSKSDIERDAIRPAKKAGKRTSANGNRYYEYRDNRVDNRQPPKKYRKLADGGNVAQNYEIELFFKGLSSDNRKIGKYVVSQKTLDNLENYLQEDWRNDISLDVIDESNKKPISWADLKTAVYAKYTEVFGKKADGGYMADGGQMDKYSKPSFESKEGIEITKKAEKVWASMPYDERVKYLNKKLSNQKGVTDEANMKIISFNAEKPWEDLAIRFQMFVEEDIYTNKMADGGMMAKGGDLSLIKKKYEENEDENAHSENVVLLAKHFGTKADLAKAKEILDLHEKEGFLSSENGKKRTELHYKLIDKARAEMGKQGIEFEKGGYMAKGGKTKDQEVVRGYFEDEAYEYGKGGNLNVPYVVYDEQEMKVLKEFKNFTSAKKFTNDYLDKHENKIGSVTSMPKSYYEKNKMLYPTKENGGYMADGGSVAKGNYEMLLSQAKEVMHHAEELMQVAKPDMDIEAWVVAKAERATTDLSDITHYLDGLKMAMGGMVKHNAHKVNA